MARSNGMDMLTTVEVCIEKSRSSQDAATTESKRAHAAAAVMARKTLFSQKPLAKCHNRLNGRILLGRPGRAQAGRDPTDVPNGLLLYANGHKGIVQLAVAGLAADRLVERSETRAERVGFCRDATASFVLSSFLR